VRGLGVALALPLVVLLGACSQDEPEASTLPVLPSAEASASASATEPATKSAPSPTPRPTPVASASQTGGPAVFPETVEGASAFARHYVETIGIAFNLADAQRLRKLSARGCEGCDALIGSIRQLQKSKHSRVGGNYEVTDVATPPIEQGDVVLLLTYTRQPSEIVDAAGTVVDRAPAVPLTNAQMRLVYGSDGWRVQGYRVV
jgi:hypothetical protein